jgi:hypothetical protein
MPRVLPLCRFCLRENQPRTMEHVYPDWLGSRLIRRRSVNRLVIQTLRYATKPKDIESLALAVEACESCNGGWLAQDDVIPFLWPMVGEPDSTVFLDRGRRAILTQWCLARVLVTDVHDEPPFFRDDERQAFALVGTPPKNTRLWIGRHDGMRSTSIYPAKYAPSGIGSPPSIFTLTYTAGHFLFQCVAWRDGRGRPPATEPVQPGYLLELVQPASDSNVLVSWPLQELRADELPALETRFIAPLVETARDSLLT